MERTQWKQLALQLEVKGFVRGVVEEISERDVTVVIVDTDPPLKGTIPLPWPVINFNVNPPRAIFLGDVLPDLYVTGVDYQQQQIHVAMEVDYAEKVQTVNWAQIQEETLRYHQELHDQQVGWLDDFHARQNAGLDARSFRAPGADGDLDMDNPADMLYEQIDELADSLPADKE